MQAVALSHTPGRIKGASIRAFIDWHGSTHGPEAVQRAIEALPPELQGDFDTSANHFGVLPSVWFPAETVHRVLDHLTDGLTPKAYDELARQGGEATVDAMMKGVQRFVFTKLMTPAAYTRVANMAFRLNYEDGRVMNTVLSPTRHRGHVEEWSSHHRFLCRMNVAIKACLYRAMGCKGVRVEERFCRSDGQRQCGSVIAWE